MSAAPDQAFGPASANDGLALMPANIEAEQALLGCLLYDNAAYERIGDFLKAEHFFEPFHQRLFAAIEATLRKGQMADPILMFDRFGSDQGLEQMGGIRYLADLVDRAPPAPNAPEYARAIYDLAVRRELIRFGDETKAIASARTDTSGRELIEQAEGVLYQLGETGQSSQGFRTFAHYLDEAVNMAAEAASRDGGLSGLSTGLMDLDAKTGGLHPSDLIVIAARPSMGKTALALNIAWNVASQYVWEPQPDGSRKTVRGGRVGFFSLEMSGGQLAMRVLATVSGVASDRLRKGDIDTREFGRVRDSALEIQDAPLFTDETGGISMAKLAARARRLKRREGLDLLIVDYIQLVTDGDVRRDANRVEVVGAITAGLKALAKELRVPVIALAQLSRAVEQREDKKPQLGDLRESGSIEQDADMVMFIYREAYYLSRLEPKEGTEEHFKWQERMEQCAHHADIIIGKQRHGPIGNVKLSYNDALTQFGNLAKFADDNFRKQGLDLSNGLAPRYTPGVDD